MPEKYVIIPAGGRGNRMGTALPKQFLELEGVPVIFRSMQAFMNYTPDIDLIIVLPAGHEEDWENLCREHSLALPHRICTGGETRFHSVKNGLAQIEGEGLVAIHDAVRPLVSLSLIKNCFETAARHGNAVPVVPLADSVRQLSGTINRPADRNALRLVQTPQVFALSLIRQAYAGDYQESFTDDAGVVESIGVPIHLVEGERRNIKITTLDDMYMAAALL